MQEWYYIATYVLAVVAVVGFIYSAVTNKRTTAALLGIERNLKAQVDPLITIADFIWQAEGTVSCENPPVGLNFFVKNISSVPVVIRPNVTKFYFGDLELTSIVSNVGPPMAVLAPGTTVSGGTTQKEEFQKYLGRPKPMNSPPYLTIYYEATFNRFGSDELYSYKTRFNIGFDCRHPNIRWAFKEQEEVLPMPKGAT